MKIGFPFVTGVCYSWLCTFAKHCDNDRCCGHVENHCEKNPAHVAALRQTVSGIHDTLQSGMLCFEVRGWLSPDPMLQQIRRCHLKRTTVVLQIFDLDEQM
uniref:Uncharacterized protein n=1 Tax=Guillardia theta TaxID=55529 RepID=A0A7S4PIQ4_GUITH